MRPHYFVFLALLLASPFSSLVAQEVVIEKYLAYAHFWETGFKDIRYTQPDVLSHLSFALPGFQATFSETDPVSLTLSARLEAAASSPQVVQETTLRDAMGRAYGTPFIILDATENDQSGFVLVAKQDQPAWEGQRLESFRYPVIEIQTVPLAGEKTEHRIHFYSPAAYAGLLDYYSRYGWRTDPRVPNKMVESRNNARLVGPVKSVREYFQDSTITAFSQAWRFSPEGLRIGYRQWDAGAGMVWADTLTEVSWHANGGLNHAISRNAFLDVGVDPSDLSAKGEFRWDEHGHITALRYSMDKDFATYTSQYNAQGQLENWQGGTQLRTITYQNALPVSMVYTVSEAEYRTTYTYDDRGRTAKIREELPNGSVQITEIVYDDAAGRRLEAFSKYQDASLESMVEVEKVLYNEHGHPIEHIHTATGDPALSWFRRYTYTYDAQNNWTQRTTTDAWDKSDTYGETLEVLSRVLTYH